MNYWLDELQNTVSNRRRNLPIFTTGTMFCMRPVNERRRCIVTSFLIGLVHTQNTRYAEALFSKCNINSVLDSVVYWKAFVSKWLGSLYGALILVSVSKLLLKMCDISKFWEIRTYPCVAKPCTCPRAIMSDIFSIFSCENVTRHTQRTIRFPLFITYAQSARMALILWIVRLWIVGRWR